ncbi:MAG: hypothetical protein MK008_01270 [Bdellovibrionales bacterium]|nr:hypothetical protein [Bdellovibrionales bacterium]
MKCKWNVVSAIGLILISNMLLAQNYNWQQDSYYDRFNKAGQSLASDFSEYLSEFEKHCGNTTKEQYCTTTNTSIESLQDVSESINMLAEWEWVKSRTAEQLATIQNKKMHYDRISQMSKNLNWVGDPESEALFKQYYDDYQKLSTIQLSYYELEKKADEVCRRSYGTRYDVTRRTSDKCLKLQKGLKELENSMSMIIENAPLLATEPVQKLLTEENVDKPISIEDFIKRPLNQSADQASSFAAEKYKSYYEIASGKFDNQPETIKEILHDPVLLMELDPTSEWFGERPTEFDKPTVCRLSQRIYREKAASVLWGFTKDVGTMATPWAAVTGAKALIGASRTIKLTKNGLRTTFFSTALASTGVEIGQLQDELQKCEQTIQNFQVSESINYDEVTECREKQNQYAFNTALVVTGQFFPLADRSDALFDPTQRLSRKKLKDMYQRSRYNSYQLKMWVEKKTFLASPERKRYVEANSEFTDIGVEHNRNFINRINNDDFEGKMVFAAEHSFLKHHNDVAPNDKGFATALNNDFKKTLYENLRQELGDDVLQKADKYSDYKNIKVVLDDTPENREAVQRAYMKTKKHIRDTFEEDLRLAKNLIEASSRNTPASDIDKIFNAGIATGSRAPDKALKLARENRKRHPEHGGAFYIKSENTKPDLALLKARTEFDDELIDADYVRDYESFKPIFDEQANNVEKQRLNVMDALLRSHPMNTTQRNKSQLLQDYEESGLLVRANNSNDNYVLSTDAIQILRKANAPRIRGASSSEAWGREIYLKKIQDKYQSRFGVKIEKEQLEDFIEYHHALDDFSPPFYSERRIDMSASNAKADVIAIDREMAGAVNEQNVALRFAGKSVTNDEEALAMAREGVDSATSVLKKWRENIRGSVIENLSVPGRIRLMGEERFNKLPQVERDKVLAGQFSEMAFEGVIKSSADDFLITPAAKLTESDLNQISRAIAQSPEKNHTRVSIAEAYPDTGINRLRRQLFNRKSTLGDLAQKQAEVGEDYAKRILDELSKNTGRDYFKPNIQIKSSRTSLGTKRFKVIVRDQLSPRQRDNLQRSINEVMGRNWGTSYGGVEYIPPQTFNYKSPKPPPPGEWMTTWLWAGQLA